MFRNKITISSLVLLFLSVKLFGQQVYRPLLSEESLEAVNRKFSIFSTNNNSQFLHVEGKPNAGIVWIKNFLFESGTIEFDVKGKDVLQESFVGIAFHGTNDSTYQAIYFRPFNFRSNDPIRRKHAVQYIALPKNDWPYLRKEFADKYEAPLLHDVDPNGWFHVKIEVSAEAIKTYINRDKTPVLVIKPLLQASWGKIGFWTGNDSDGDFTDLRVLSKEKNKSINYIDDRVTIGHDISQSSN